ncbi:MAG: DUF262 domain-containing protein [Nitrosopumilus sp.]|nr:DUF262 domain-containing protein [Nitrosopumilus sp.]
MKATETPFISFMQKTTQFSIPIYQRTYSWTNDQCTQLWNDIVNAGKDDSVNGHFIGSIVYISEGLYEVSSVPEVIVIDGQQRLTTLSLFLSALGKILDEQDIESEISSKKINNYYLFNREEEDEKRYKLILTQRDKNTFIDLIEGRDPPADYSPQIVENYNFFLEKIRNSELTPEQIYKGICKLMIVSISLDRTSDDPQLIFESLNSTGLKLSQADLIRNFVLMGLEKALQKDIYHNYWYPMEQRFATMEDSKYFDRFMRDYLTVKTGQIPNKGQVYESFKRYWISVRDIPIEKLMDDITRFSKHYANLIFANFEESDINKIAKNINTLKVDVVYPFLLEILEDYKNQVISKSELIEIMNLSESYVFRRAICDVPTSSLNKTFANLTKEIDKDDYLTSLKASFINKRTYKRFPNDDEFKREFVLKNVYNFRIRSYLFSKLENHDHKEPIDTVSEYTVEHIMPQNPNMSPEWRQSIGENWQEVHNEFLHTVGNLTLTGYNSELSDRSFLEKRDMKGGFADSHLMINHALATLETWNKDEIIKRGKDLSELASQIWSAPKLSDEILEKYQAIEEVVDEDEDEDESERKKWGQILDYAKPETREIVENMISKIKEKFNCIGEPYGRWYYLYVNEPQEMKNCFAVITCGVGTTNICIRVNPETFSYEDELIRTVKGFFFPEEHERRMSIKPETLEKILTYLEHSVKITKDSD